ncbi:GntR family transcriptional regulator [Virgibacillus kekensis]|uniref:GntR family transcriptional regulator n=1 Tax=Virgibacillus kekensis TaxID=202261 RepID=A0ABV9DI90_9BACI
MKKAIMKPIAKKRTTKEIVYDELKKAILDRSIDNQEILTETLLAESLNTSRTPIREAVAELVREGLLVQIPRKGFHVRVVSEGEQEQIMFLRRTIESEGLKKLARIITEEQINRLNEIVSEQEKAMLKEDRVRYIELDQIFHRKILEFANQNILGNILQDMYNLARLIGHNALAKEGRMKEVIQEHKDIIIALSRKNGEEAAKLVRHHLDVTVARIKGLN